MTPSPAYPSLSPLSFLSSRSSRSSPLRRRIAPLFQSLLCTALLSGCHDSPPPDLHPWLAQARDQARPHPLPAMTLPAMPAHWRPEPAAADPFGLQLTAQSGRPDAPGQKAPVPALEPVALPPMRAVAILHRAGASRALLQIGSRMLQVVPGDALPGLPGHVLEVDERTVRLQLDGREVRLDLGMGGTTTIAPPPGAPT